MAELQRQSSQWHVLTGQRSCVTGWLKSCCLLHVLCFLQASCKLQQTQVLDLLSTGLHCSAAGSRQEQSQALATTSGTAK